MSLEELKQLPVSDLAAKDCVLFLWATFPQLREALELIEAWGFKYKTVAFVWLKKNKVADSWFYGLGFWTRGNAEICLLATKGKPKRQSPAVHQFIISPIEAHSKKPDEARNKIVHLIAASRLERRFPMAFVPVPKDLNRVKTKVMFNLTKRQLICFALAAAAGVPIFFLTKPSLGISTSAMLMVVIMLPFIFFALYEKDGQPAEKILGHVIKSMFLRDKVRPYRTNNLYAAIQQEIKEKEELQIAQQHEKGRRA